MVRVVLQEAEYDVLSLLQIVVILGLGGELFRALVVDVQDAAAHLKLFPQALHPARQSTPRLLLPVQSLELSLVMYQFRNYSYRFS